MKTERQSNIELLRILAIMGVIVLHYNNVGMGGGLKYVERDSINFYLLYYLESLFICSVDLFMLISGYFMCYTQSVSLWKPLKLITQVVVFKASLYLISLIVTGNPLSFKTLVGRIIPANYFVILYCCVYILSPFINFSFAKINKKSLKTMMITLLLLFSVYPTLVDLLAGLLKRQTIIGLSSIGMYGSQWGYNVVNFVLMYVIGSYLRKNELSLYILSKKKLISILILLVSLLVIWARANLWLGIYAGHNAWEYCNPIVIFEAVVLFMLFKKINIGVNRIVNRLAKSVFTVFLLHTTFLKYFNIKHFVNENTVVMLLHIFISCIFIFCICSFVHFVYSKIENLVFEFIEKKVSMPMVSLE